MDSGVAAFLGALAGAVASMGGIVLTDYMKSYRKRRADAPRKRLLIDMLSAGRSWRTLGTLANVTGLSESEAKRLLVQIGARGSETDPNLWGLLSRNPLPTQPMQPTGGHTS
jgi:hypothetical protein